MNEPTPPSAAAPSSPTPVSPELNELLSPAPPPPEPEPSTGQQLLSVMWSILGGIFNWFIVPIGLVLILHNFVFQAFHVLGSSMVPTLHESDYLIISKIGATGAKIGKLFGRDTAYIPKPGEVVVLHYPKDPNLIFVKRVMGVPGDRVVVKDGKLTVYNNAHPDGYDPAAAVHATLASDITLGNVDDVVPKNSIFVVGDNRTPGGSFDSREWGFAPSSYIIGEAVARLLPLNQARLLTLPIYLMLPPLTGLLPAAVSPE